jgi:hypothetical protein
MQRWLVQQRHGIAVLCMPRQQRQHVGIGHVHVQRWLSNDWLRHLANVLQYACELRDARGKGARASHAHLT